MANERSKKEAEEITEANRALRKKQSEQEDPSGSLSRIEEGRESVRPQPADKD